MAIPENFAAFVVAEHSGEADSNKANGKSSRQADASLNRQFKFADLDEGEVVIKTKFSALNYKDALAANAHPGVARKLPLIPGIDGVGTVVEPGNSSFSVGDEVLVAHGKFGTANHGGLAEFIRVAPDWVYRLPNSLGLKTAVTWGTAGFTAAQSVEKIIASENSQSGPILVTGATGGVGCFAVKLLAKLGYHVVAATGKKEKHDWLKEQGAKEIITREEATDTSDVPLLKGKWTGVVDTVGGITLVTALKSCAPHACVTACGLVAGHELPMTVYPFILRGVTLHGIDSAGIMRDERERLWGKIANQWGLDLEGLATDIGLEEVPVYVDKLLNGQVVGRTIVNFEG